MSNKKQISIDNLLKLVEKFGKQFEPLKLECGVAGKHLNLRYLKTDPSIMYYTGSVDAICEHCHTYSPQPLRSEDYILIKKTQDDYEKMLRKEFTI